MEFWGVEVKPGQTVKCEPGDEGYLHLSQASLGEIKKDKGTENVPVFVKFNDQKLVLGTLSTENCAQIQYDIVFEKEFELSHGSKNTSVFFVGYKSIHENYAYPF
ncbi:hypothetical protein KFK09_005167 [Dendrobium nobile]|uniref:Nucleoplasmin-like domain-containing protein n=1 Tax=Dendrobium nobile TaxID=94219 RepID=A0A8T3BXH6_DENNO|nr:hypothetical protein KFK09_005167 [Dendrobium nobile]